MWMLAALVSFARVYVGAHFPLDCLGGAALGYAAALWGLVSRRRPPRRFAAAAEQRPAA